MYVVLGCLYRDHNSGLILAALAICTFACATARAMVLRSRAHVGRSNLLWLMGAGSVAGAGVWATHFVSMLAYQPGLPVQYHLGLTMVSGIVAIVLPAAAGALTFSRFGIVGGMLFGVAVLVMHYVGIAAMEMPATYIWNHNIVVSSVIIGVSLGGLAGHFSSLRSSFVGNLLPTVLRITTILGVHFSGMAALTIVPTGGALAADHAVILPEYISLLVIGTAAFVVSQALILALVDRHLKSRSEQDAAKMRAYIAELEQTKMRLESASVAAEAASKSKSAFLASMSHELRTPLNAVIGFSETILSEAFGPVSPPRCKEYLESIQGSGKHLLDLINDILDIARFDAGHAELNDAIFDPVIKIEDTVRMMQAQSRKAEVKLVVCLSKDLPLLNGDRRRIRQILLNLISNGIKFTKPGGNVTVTAWFDTDFYIQVSDSGIGMARQDFAKALEPFGQIDSSLARKYEGTGLGLPLTRQLTEMHGGTLSLESEVGVGTTVTIRLPQWRTVPRREYKAA